MRVAVYAYVIMVRGGGGRLGRGAGVGGGKFPSVPCSDYPLRTRGHPFNGEPWHLPCPRKQPARKSKDGPPGPVPLLGPGSLRVDRRQGAVGGWWLALCRRALGATWSRGGGGRWVACRFVRSSSPRSFFLSFFRTSCIFRKVKGILIEGLVHGACWLVYMGPLVSSSSGPAPNLDRWHRQLNGRCPTFCPCRPGLFSQVGKLARLGSGPPVPTLQSNLRVPD